MQVLLQRVREAAVRVGQEVVAQIGPGLLIFLGVGRGDSEKEADFLAHKTANLRIFADENQKMNLSLLNVGGQALTVSQFTLFGDCRKGLRPSFSQAAPPDEAKRLYEYFSAQLAKEGIEVQTGIFQADMQVSLINDGPVTITINS
ncbi:MAG: D-tyrosyl-tRNA(Tyr) deacylase [Clostridiales bacterium]|nr:D-tyrosyl-tRNA(Tyr) deacylase [Clostridiales bacterium]